MWVCAFGCNFGQKMEKNNLLKQQLDSRHAKTTATPIYETAAHIKFKLHVVTLAQKVNNSIFTTFQEKQKTFYLF